MSTKFAEGSKVKSLNHNHHYGEVGIVEENDRLARSLGAFNYKVVFSDGDWAPFDEEELEAVSETPKAGSKFYVAMVHDGRTFDTLEEAQAFAKERAEYNTGDTYAVFQPTKAFLVPTEAQEVTLA